MIKVRFFRRIPSFKLTKVYNLRQQITRATLHHHHGYGFRFEFVQFWFVVCRLSFSGSSLYLLFAEWFLRCNFDVQWLSFVRSNSNDLRLILEFGSFIHSYIKFWPFRSNYHWSISIQVLVPGYVDMFDGSFLASKFWQTPWLDDQLVTTDLITSHNI